MDDIKHQLADKGWVIIENALDHEDCDRYVAKYNQWLKHVEQVNGGFPHNYKSLITEYRSGHMEASWEIRLKIKDSFAKIWETDKLLTSFDIPAIGSPPEDGSTEFYTEGSHWLHCDQSAERIGLHCYQGAVYLETADEDDWCFHALEGSHFYHSEFYEAHPEHIEPSIKQTHCDLADRPSDIAWYKNKGAVEKRIAVPKGGLLLWDSRLIHANALPKKDRKNPGRWRYILIVAMAPAIWIDENDLATKRDAYEKINNTGHWPSEGIEVYPPGEHTTNNNTISELPGVAQTHEAKQLAGVVPYDFNDGQPCGPDWKPEWKRYAVSCRKWDNECTEPKQPNPQAMPS
ncbi:unnamed protein product [Owenia fusiformis]|uniref:Uncharacterized protein n=1 Tax=Owenia fusiformis TaxID=6347 RepID=A0A8J1XW44_OWEFU|nr:unnamed protein product [Owenia fusiformis]